MFFKVALQGKNHFWRYLVVFVSAFLAANTIGAIPLGIVMVIAISKNPDVISGDASNIMDFSLYGIDPNVGLILIVFSFVVGLITTLLLIKPLHGRSYKTLFNGVSVIRWRRIFSGFALWFAIMAVYLGVSVLLDPSNFVLNNTSPSLIILVLVSLLLLPFQTTFEEVLFRGYLMQGIGVWTRSRIIPWLVTSLLFGLMHSFNPEIKEYGFWLMMPQYLIFGLAFGIITIMDEGIELAMGAHAANNIFLSIFVTQRAAALQTDALLEQQEIFPLTDLVSITVVSVLFVIFLRYLYRWDWKGQLKYKTDDQVQ
jgi:membrane protease YdiL (CAAX protease family)